MSGRSPRGLGASTDPAPPPFDRYPEPPLDRRLDRRDFLRRLGVLTSAASAGALAPVWDARPAAAAPVPTVRIPRQRVQETDPADLTVLEAASLMREGGVSPLEIARACLSRITAHDPLLRAFNRVEEEALLEGARAATEALGRGAQLPPLHGIPLALKDNFFTAGVPTTANSHIYRDFVPEYDAEAWRRLRGAGALLVGKTQMGPLATSRATTPDGEVTTRNAWAPHDARVSPGGSSSGSATAVAARLAPGATGTQTGGSITNPADAQGLTGIKPTMGRVSLRGVIPLTYTRDHPGPLARDARDAALLLSLMAGPDPADPRTLGQPPLPDLLGATLPAVGSGGSPRLRWPTRVGVFPDYLSPPAGPPPEPPGPDADPEEQAAWRFRTEAWERRREAYAPRAEFLRTLGELGAEVVELPYPQDWSVLTGGDFNNARLPERSEPFLEHLRRDVRLFGVSLSPWINGMLLSGTEYLTGQRARLLLASRILDGIFGRCDVVALESPIPFDIVGLPLISFPVGMTGSGPAARPVGALLGGMPWAEDRLLAVAGAYQAVTDWHRRRPPDPESGVDPVPGRSGEAPLRLDVLDVLESGE
ncbi:MAG: amidase [Longimicrobiales bacterium]|nr:amidase [Longimicrobiales bacterium]